MNIKDMDIWKKSIEFVVKVYQITSEYPSEEKFGIINQMRRAAVSVSSNLVEGSARHSDKDFLRFLYISLGSIAEVDTQIIISQKLNYISLKQLENISRDVTNLKKMYLGLIKYLKEKPAK
ncbi:MAG: four helix bundle protein [Candidatus Stygibacter australis]|nr:four helix bundle protein [Candidatus Stygibacter australis]